MNNKQKNLKYADLMLKLKKSINNEFYYESIFIEYAIFEDRTESLLRHAKYKTKDIDSKNFSLCEKLSKITNNTRFNTKNIRKYITKELLDKINVWRIKRNKLIHDLINSPYTNEQIELIAKEGYDLVKTLNNKSTQANKYLDEHTNES